IGANAASSIRKESEQAMKTRAVLPERCRGCDVIWFSRGFWLTYLGTDPWRGARLLHGKQGGQLNSFWGSDRFRGAVMLFVLRNWQCELSYFLSGIENR